MSIVLGILTFVLILVSLFIVLVVLAQKSKDGGMGAALGGGAAEAAFGAVGLETMLSAALGLHHNEHMPLSRLVEAMSSRPAEILGLEAGRLAPGAPADFALIDLNLSWTVEEDTLRSRAKNSPFEHRTLEGRAVETIVAGESVYAYPRGH